MYKAPHPQHRRKHSAGNSPSPAPNSPTTAANPPLKRQKLQDSYALSNRDRHGAPSPGGLGRPVERGSRSEEAELRGLRLESPSEGDGDVSMESKINKGKAKEMALEPDEPVEPEGPAWTPVGSKADKQKAKKRKKQLMKIEDNPPEFHFDTRGFRNGRQVKLPDVRDLVLHVHADEKQQNWMFIKNKSNILHTVVLMIPGITPETLGVDPPSPAANLPFSLSSSTSRLPIMQKLFSHACPTKATGERCKMHSCVKTFLTCQMSANARSRRDEERKKLSLSALARDPVTYLLSSDIMLEQGYPPTSYPETASPTLRLEARVKSPSPYTRSPSRSLDFASWQRPDEWIQTPWPINAQGELDKAILGQGLEIIGIDCEMCMTKSGSALTRVSVVDRNGSPVYDSLVQPSEPIVDYLTRYSGMTAERLNGVTTTLLDVQKDLSRLIDFNTVLVGHSLECDLRALKLAHPWVIDTSVIYHHPKGPPFKSSLKWLAQKWLGKEIQTQPRNDGAGAAAGGHDSEEDARAAVELLTKKLEKGPGFGEFGNDTEAVFDRLARGTDPCLAAVVDYGAAGVGYAGKAKTAIGCASDDEMIDGVVNNVNEHGFVFGRLMELSHALGWSQPAGAKAHEPDPSPTSSALPTPSISPCPPDVDAALAKLDANISRLHEALPRGTALILFTGHGDPRDMNRLHQKKARFDRLYKTQAVSTIGGEDKWMAEDDRALSDAVDKCRSGLSFYRIR